MFNPHLNSRILLSYHEGRKSSLKKYRFGDDGSHLTDDERFALVQSIEERIAEDHAEKMQRMIKMMVRFKNAALSLFRSKEKLLISKPTNDTP